MSGPKGYVAPRRYSRQVFEGRLEKLFLLQARVRQIVDVLRSCVIDDADFGVHIDWEQWLSDHAAERTAVMAPLRVDVPAEGVDQTARDAILAHIDRRIGEARSFIAVLERQQVSHAELEDDHRAFREYVNFATQGKKSFGVYRDRIATQVLQGAPPTHRESFEKVAAKIRAIEPHLPESGFASGFRGQNDGLRRNVIDRLDEGVQRIDHARGELADALAAASRPTRENVPFDVRSMLYQIDEALRRTADHDVRGRFATRLEELLHSSAFRPHLASYFDGLLVELADAERVAAKYEVVRSALADAEATALRHPEFDAYQDRARGLLSRLRLKDAEVEDFVTTGQRLTSEEQARAIAETNEALEREHEAREREFIRIRIVAGLERRGYKVQTDARTIDFTEQREFLFTAPGAESYVSLRFDEELGIFYNFWVDDPMLSISAERNARRHMARSCDAFKQVVGELDALGVKLGATFEMGVEEARLLALPSRFRKRLGPRKKAAAQPELVHKRLERREEE